MRRLFVFLIFCISTNHLMAAEAPANCVWPDSTRSITGVLFPRDVKVSSTGSKPTQFLLIRLATPECIIGYDEDTRIVQLIFNGPDKTAVARAMVGSTVTAYGTLSLAETGHHIAPIFMIVDRISETSITKEPGIELIAIPVINVEPQCSGFAKGNSITYNYCINKQQLGYDRIKSIWDQVSIDVKRKCLSIDESNKKSGNPYRYSNLSDCIDVFTQQEFLNGTRQIPKDKFRY